MFSKAIQFSRRVSLVVRLVHGPLYFLRYLVPIPSVRVHLWCCAVRVDGFPERRKDTKNEQCKKYEKFLDGIETRTMKIRMASWH